VVLVSDHGEALGEGDFYFEHQGLYDGVTRIAMVLRLPGLIRAGGRIAPMVAGYDLAPTILELLGLSLSEVLSYELTGRSLWPLLDGSAPAIHEALVLTEATRQASYALRTPDWKLIVPVTYDAHGAPIPDVYGRLRDPRPLLFDLRADPCEKHDVHAKHPHVAEDLQARLARWVQEELRRWGGPDPVATQASASAFADAIGKYRERAGGRGDTLGMA
jgi:arylsulfatase A-like enzyme